MVSFRGYVFTVWFVTLEITKIFHRNVHITVATTMVCLTQQEFFVAGYNDICEVTERL